MTTKTKKKPPRRSVQLSVSLPLATVGEMDREASGRDLSMSALILDLWNTRTKRRNVA